MHRNDRSRLGSDHMPITGKYLDAIDADRSGFSKSGIDTHPLDRLGDRQPVWQVQPPRCVNETLTIYSV